MGLASEDEIGKFEDAVDDEVQTATEIFMNKRCSCYVTKA